MQIYMETLNNLIETKNLKKESKQKHLINEYAELIVNINNINSKKLFTTKSKNYNLDEVTVYNKKQEQEKNMIILEADLYRKIIHLEEIGFLKINIYGEVDLKVGCLYYMPEDTVELIKTIKDIYTLKNLNTFENFVYQALNLKTHNELKIFIDDSNNYFECNKMS